MLVAKKKKNTNTQKNMRTEGDCRRCTTQKTTSNECIYILPYSKNNDAAVTLENGTAAMEEQQLLKTD
jgi:hypothetical protein